ncbi:MAG: energy-coupling factor transporter transmembrane component T [Herbinix sp.]|nr:energy-coupling factor transporter transmembrane component T [Herbinix sp.]
MIRDITIGQYYPADSILHRLDPRVKLIGTFAFIVSLFLFHSLYGYILVALFLASIIKLSKVPFGFIVKGLKAVVVLLLFTSFFNLFLTPGTKIIFEWGFIHISDRGLNSAIFFSIRLILLILGSSLMTFTTTPNQLTDGLEKVMKPLNHIKVPVHEIAMMMSIALRFIPILLEETDKIMKAQMARGADFESGGILKRAKSLIPLLVPLFVSAFRRANDLAMAMEARCYRGGDGRTKMKPLRYNPKDYMAYFVLLFYLAAIITIQIIENMGIINKLF